MQISIIIDDLFTYLGENLLKLMKTRRQARVVMSCGCLEAKNLNILIQFYKISSVLSFYLCNFFLFAAIWVENIDNTFWTFIDRNF